MRALALALLLTLSACGFQLRGMADLPFSSLYLDRGPSRVVASGLERALTAGSKTQLTQRPEEAQAVLSLLSEENEKRILTLGGTGRVREYQLVYRVGFRLQDKQGREIIPAQLIELRRDFTYDDTQALAKESEEALLVRDMQNDLVQEIMRRLRTVRLQG